MNTQKLLLAADHLSSWIGKAFAWLIIVLMTVVCVEVFKRYVLNAPTAWIFDFNNMLYGTLFMMCGAYALAQNAHVRGDFLYSSMRPRTRWVPPQSGARAKDRDSRSRSRPGGTRSRR